MKQHELKNNSIVEIPDGTLAKFLKMDGMYAHWEVEGIIKIGNFEDFEESDREGVDYQVINTQTWKISVNEEKEPRNFINLLVILTLLAGLFNLSIAIKIGDIKRESFIYERNGKCDIDTMKARGERKEKTEVIISYYTASPDETDSTPCLTADMTNICIGNEKIVACNWLPFDTIVEIDGENYRVADRMNRRYGEPYMDMLVETKTEAFELGIQNKLVIIK